jgi:hypothetical protein
MITYCSDGFRPIKHGEHDIDGPLAAAVAFAARLAHREFGQGGLCRTIRLESSSRDGVCTAVTRRSSAHQLSGARPPATTCGSRSISNAIETPH